jgi:hypothetical protein
MTLKFVGQFYFVSSFNRVLQAHADNGEMHASQDVDSIGTEERWNVYVWDDGKIALQNFSNNAFLSAEPGGRAVCNRPTPDIWEMWQLYGLNNKVAFFSYQNTWLTAQAPGSDTEFGGEVIANRTACGEWEQFSMIPAAGVPMPNSWWDTVQQVIGVADKLIPIIAAVAGYTVDDRSNTKIFFRSY